MSADNLIGSTTFQIFCFVGKLLRALRLRSGVTLEVTARHRASPFPDELRSAIKIFRQAGRIDHYDMKSTRAMRTKLEILFYIGSARGARNEVDGAR